MLVHSSTMAVRSCWILAGTGTRCRICRSRASQTCSIGDISIEFAGHARTGMFSASRNCVQILATWGRALSCYNMRWWSWMNGTTMGLRISSRYLCAFKMTTICAYSVHSKWPPLNRRIFITYACPHINPPPPWATRSTTLTSANCSPTRRHTSALYSENRDSSVKRSPLQSARRHRMWAFAHSSRLWRQTVVRSRPRWGRRACRWASLRRFLTIVQKFFGYANWLLQQLSGWLASDNLGGEDAGFGGPGLLWLHVVCGCEAGWMYCQILWNAFGDGLW